MDRLVEMVSEGDYYAAHEHLDQMEIRDAVRCGQLNRHITKLMKSDLDYEIDNETIFDVALSTRNVGAIELVIYHGVTLKFGHLKPLRELGVDLTRTDAWGSTLLFGEKDPDVCDALCEAGVNVNHSRNGTALDMAISLGNFQAASVLYHRGSNVKRYVKSVFWTQQVFMQLLRLPYPSDIIRRVSEM
jgi:hypothetical protein